eukprot:12781455-Prorocentrum_lima.AAC.1
MTSSLVGSEMCIRDRPDKNANEDKAASPAKPTKPKGSPKGVKCAGGKTVSYTHLTLPTICSV